MSLVNKKMKQKTIFTILIALLISFNAFAQKEPELAIALLANDNIAKVNVDQDSFIKSIGNISALSKKEFVDIDKNQKIAILLVIHKSGKATIEFFSNPKIDEAKENIFLEKLNTQIIKNTNFVDFPILILVNAKFEELNKDFTEFISPSDKVYQEYQNADLKTKYELNKKFATEILSVLGAYQIIVDDQFVGVKNFGILTANTDFYGNQDIEKLTSNNSDYWRAIMEMSVGNQLIPITKIFMIASQGKFDYALKYLEIISLFSDPKSISDKYLNELADRLNLFNKQLNSSIQEGFVYHDQGKYEKALTVYNEILKEYPNSAWAKYEVYYSQNAFSIENKLIKLDDRSDWDNAKVGIYKSNPLYNMDIRASNGREGYLLFRRASISELFKNNDNRLNDIYKYADIAMDLEIYDFAAQLFWLTYTFDKKSENSLNMFLYCLEKLRVTNLKENFKGDFVKEFKKIEKIKEKEMTDSKTYKAFKN